MIHHALIPTRKSELTSRDHGFAGPGTWIKLQAVRPRLAEELDSLAGGANLQSVFQVLINLHDCSLVTASVAVVGG